MYELLLKIAALITEFVGSLGYFGIFFMTMIEGTFIPIPSEITLIPAGYLIAKQQFNLWYVLFWSISGTLCGVLINYFVAFYYGRKIIAQYGKYFFFSTKKLDKIEAFFQEHGPISVFTGRILPGIKHFISFPAGLGKMELKLFLLYSTFGATLWISILLAIGYFIEDNEQLINQYIHQVTIWLILFTMILVIVYIWRHRTKK